MKYTKKMENASAFSIFLFTFFMIRAKLMVYYTNGGIIDGE